MSMKNLNKNMEMNSTEDESYTTEIKISGSTANSMKDSLIKSLSKLEMSVLTLNRKDINSIIKTYEDLNELKKLMKYVRKYVSINSFILNHIQGHIDKYEFYLRNKFQI